MCSTWSRRRYERWGLAPWGTVTMHHELCPNAGCLQCLCHLEGGAVIGLSQRTHLIGGGLKRPPGKLGLRPAIMVVLHLQMFHRHQTTCTHIQRSETGLWCFCINSWIEHKRTVVRNGLLVNSAPPWSASPSPEDLYTNMQWLEMSLQTAAVVVHHLQEFHHHQMTCTQTYSGQKWASVQRWWQEFHIQVFHHHQKPTLKHKAARYGLLASHSGCALRCLTTNRPAHDTKVN